MQLRRGALHQIGPNRWREAEPQQAVQFFAAARGKAADFARVLEHAPRDFHDLRAYRRQHDARGRAFDELRAETLLQRLDLFAQRRLCRVDALGRPSEMARLRDRDEILELSQTGHWLHSQDRQVHRRRGIRASP